jgi:type III pantothenate kinase
LLPLSGAREAWIASVAPLANPAVEAAAAASGFRTRFIDSGADRIIELDIEAPDAAGVDRLLSALAAGRRHFPAGAGPAGYAVVQCGSAATVDWVDGRGVFRGGYILPGPEMWLSGLALAARIADYSGGSPDWEAAEIGRNTRDAVRRGLAVGLPAAVAAAFFQIRRQAGAGESEAPFSLVVTGGWGRAAARLLPNPILDGELLLHGIRLFAADREGPEHG